VLRRRKPPAREPRIHVGDPRFDGWEVVRDFEDLESAGAWRPLDRFGRGDVALRVPPGLWSEAEELLGEEYD
jgi:hypothetical protein